MIEFTMNTDYETGNTFIDSVRIVEPIEYRNGMHIEKVPFYSNRYNLDFMKKLGFIKVDTDFNYACDIYARKGLPASYYKFCNKLSDIKLGVTRWLYKYGRVFQPINHGEMFSWKYFTPVYFSSPYIKRYINWVDNIGEAK